MSATPEKYTLKTVRVYLKTSFQDIRTYIYREAPDICHVVVCDVLLEAVALDHEKKNTILADLAIHECGISLVEKNLGPSISLKDVSSVIPRKDLKDKRLQTRWQYLSVHSQYLKQSRAKRVKDGPPIIREWYTRRLKEIDSDIREHVSQEVSEAINDPRDQWVRGYAEKFDLLKYHVCDKILEEWIWILDSAWHPSKPQPDWWPSDIPHKRIPLILKKDKVRFLGILLSSKALDHKTAPELDIEITDETVNEKEIREYQAILTEIFELFHLRMSIGESKKLIGPGPRENESMGYCPVQRILTIDDSPLGHLKELDNIFYMMWQFYDCNGNPGNTAEVCIVALEGGELALQHGQILTLLQNSQIVENIRSDRRECVPRLVIAEEETPDGSGYVPSYTVFSIHESVPEPGDSIPYGWERIPDAIIRENSGGIWIIEDGWRRMAGPND